MATWLLLVGVFLFLLLTLLLAYLVRHYLTYGHGSSTETGTIPVDPFFGAIRTLVKHEHDLWEYLTSVLEQSRSMSFTTFVPGVTWFFTANPDHIQHILKDNFANYPKGDDLRDTMCDLLGHGIFTVDSEQWKQQRKTASFEFSTNSLRNLIVASVAHEVTNRLLPTLDSAVASRKALDMHDVFLRFTFDNICQVGFGVDVAALSPDFPTVPFARSFDRATSLTAGRYSIPPPVWHLMRYLQWGTEKELRDEIKVVDGFISKVLEKRRKELAGKQTSETQTAETQTEGGAGSEHSDLLSRMFLLADKDGGSLFTDTFLRDACLNFIVAGRDTTAVTLSWFFWRLTQHPEVEEKIVQEVDSIVRKRQGDFESPLSFEELKLMNYTQAALNESMRLHATVPIDQRCCSEDDTLPDGTVIKKGWRVSYVIWSVGRMTRVWGPDALEFKPERWITEDGQLKVESPFKFNVFNGGPRLCLGREMAYLQMKSVVGSLLRRYRLKLVPGHKVGYTSSLTLLMKDGLLMSVEKK